jgi:small subunit ribosomal protein S16
VAVKIRLKRMGKIRAPYYRIVVADSRTKRDGRVIEEIGKYHPTENPSVIEVSSDRAQYWLGVGAQPTEQVRALLKLTGDWGTFKGEKGAKNTVQIAEPKPEFKADSKKKPVLRPKVVKAPVEEAPVAAPVEAAAPAEDVVVDAPVADEAAAETPVAEAPAAEEAAAEAPAEDAVAEEAPAAEEAPVADEAPAQEAPAEEAPAEAPVAEEAAAEAPAEEVPAAEEAPADDAETKPAE